MSLPGAAADRRVRLAPWEVVSALAAMCQALEESAGAANSPSARPRLGGWSGDERMRALGRGLAAELEAAHGRSLVVCGQNDKQAQVLTAHANQLLGNYGTTLSVARPSLQRLGDDGALLALQAELDAGAVDLESARR